MRYKNYKNKNNILKKIFIFFLFFSLFNLSYTKANDDVDDLNTQIEQKKKDLIKLDKEIEEQKKILQQTSGQATTLQSKINSLEANRKKIETEIKKTQTEINKADLTIKKINSEILDKELQINKNLGNIANIIKQSSKLESKSFVEKILSSNSLNDVWTDLDNYSKIQLNLKSEIDIWTDLTSQLKEKENEKSIEKKELSEFQTELSGQKESVQLTKKEQQDILIKTKNKEAEYKKILDQKIAQKKAFEQEVLDIESKIKLLIDPKSYPGAKNGVIGWPVDDVRITQLFGGTQFAKTNPGIYGRAFHPGVDFGVPIGTKVKSVSSGTVQAVGNTDAYPGCNAWGKWILVKHDNGLTSLYAHLSSILVSAGQKVQIGSVIGLSGNSGVSTGPHLHLTLYASQGVQVGKYSSYKAGTGCSATDATGPFADLDAYLDPMNYLPR